ncbi:aldehyde dehydrogenase (NADP(+)) [Pseudomonas silvicola]|nr:aldehyde dehydrogenase (NADP(+)) [Pseudomonas silvicola]
MSSPEIIAIDQAVEAARVASRQWAESDATVRSSLLDALADALEQHQTDLIALADLETNLGTARLTGEVARTAFQLRGFAREVRDGVPYQRVDDEAVAGAPPAGRPALSRVQEPLGPVAMFSASNFPFAFSVLGGDTASALAAGCPVVVKAHSGHPQLSKAVHAVASQVLANCGLPAGLLGLVEGASRAAGTHLVTHPDISAVAFTGSFQGGTALWKAANDRPRPIPFFGELGSINPLLALPEVLEKNGEALASTLASSITMGCGQFCTSPGVIVLFDHPASDRFVDQLCTTLRPLPTHAMLTPGMRQGFESGVAHLAASPQARLLFEPPADSAGPAPRLFEVNTEAFIADPTLREEMFGPAAVVLKIRSVEQAVEVFSAIGGSLTATLWGLDHDTAQNRTLIHAARQVAGRVLFAGVPTGVAVCHAQEHGGPWPASTRPETTSVGYAALQRFLRPVALQDAPAWLQPR